MSAGTLPTLPSSVPRQGGALVGAIGWLGWRAIGWSSPGTAPDVARCVVIVAPHTSNWDFPVGLFFKMAIRLGVRFVGKHTLFRFPLGGFMRAMGGIAVDRSAPQGFVEEVAAAFRDSEKLWLVVAPEGTRRRAPRWKSGFHRIARAAGVPILPVAFDYRTRTLRFLPLFHPTADYEADVRVLARNFSPTMALKPENYGDPLGAAPDHS
jgi:1-acyl-sn-glycerol-3-phosphate acyltransferase